MVLADVFDGANHRSFASSSSSMLEEALLKKESFVDTMGGREGDGERPDGCCELRGKRSGYINVVPSPPRGGGTSFS